MFEKIIISSEPSSEEHDITECLKGLKKLGTEKCLLLYCLDPSEGGAKISSFYQKTLESYAEKQKVILESQGYEVEKSVDFGEADDEVNMLARDYDYSLVVVGGTIQSIIREKFLGGMEYKIIHHSRIPVLVVRISKAYEDELLTERCQIADHVLFPTDFSNNSKEAFRLILEMVKSGVKKVSLVHVAERNIADESKREIMEKLQGFEMELIKSGAEKVEVKILHGEPSDEIIGYTEESDATLVVMGSQGRGFLQEIFIGSVSHDLVRRSPVSVLLVPAKR
ncbi:universal stress protein [Gudongella sp. DL1XJH-153]|uniref:universal stress protein n=1 Tax=Gudongella sp. DL1XJH-153 TaxID=3409804 RepID=UPI003BB4A99D